MHDVVFFRYIPDRLEEQLYVANESNQRSQGELLLYNLSTPVPYDQGDGKGSEELHHGHKDGKDANLFHTGKEIFMVNLSKPVHLKFLSNKELDRTHPCDALLKECIYFGHCGAEFPEGLSCHKTE